MQHMAKHGGDQAYLRFAPVAKAHTHTHAQRTKDSEKNAQMRWMMQAFVCV
jgi:hypothetical protein